MLETLYYHNIFIGIALVLTGCMLYVSDKMTPGKKTERNMTVLDALIIGLCQCVAVVPGLSRSGTTITAGIATGLRRDFAVKFSFLMSLPAVLGANILSIVDAVQEGIGVEQCPDLPRRHGCRAGSGHRVDQSAQVHKLEGEVRRLCVLLLGHRRSVHYSDDDLLIMKGLSINGTS